MKPRQKLSYFAAIMLVAAGTGHAQSLIADFDASGYTGGTTWTDSEGNLTATYVGGSAAVKNATSVTTNGGFAFSTGDLAGFDGSSSYTVAVGFNAASISSSGGPYAFQGDGVFGADINGYGQGDIGLSLSNYQGGSILAGGGDQSGGDDTVSGPEASGANPPAGSFALNQETGAVLVVQASSISLYVNGTLVGQDTGIAPQPVGFTGNRFSGSIEPTILGLA